MCSLRFPIIGCSQSIGGIRRFWLARKAHATEFRYEDDELGIIEWVLNSAGIPTPFLEFECDMLFNSADEALSIANTGKSFPVGIVMRFVRMDYSKRAIFESMIYDKLVCVYQDSNGRYWLLGQENGLQVTTYEATSDNIEGGNRYTLRLQGRERFLVREVMGDNIYDSPNGGGQSGASANRAPSPGTLVRDGLGGELANGGVDENLLSWGAYQSGVMVVPMPISQLGMQPIVDIIQL